MLQFDILHALIQLVFSLVLCGETMVSFFPHVTRREFGHYMNRVSKPRAVTPILIVIVFAHNRFGSFRELKGILTYY